MARKKIVQKNVANNEMTRKNMKEAGKSKKRKLADGERKLADDDSDDSDALPTASPPTSTSASTSAPASTSTSTFFSWFCFGRRSRLVFTTLQRREQQSSTNQGQRSQHLRMKVLGTSLAMGNQKCALDLNESVQWHETQQKQ